MYVAYSRQKQKVVEMQKVLIVAVIQVAMIIWTALMLFTDSQYTETLFKEWIGFVVLIWFLGGAVTSSVILMIAPSITVFTLYGLALLFVQIGLGYVKITPLEMLLEFATVWFLVVLCMEVVAERLYSWQSKRYSDRS